jgi:enolase-phosphatase E1
VSQALAGVRVILLDIEGTTTQIAFVHQHLFSHARAHVDQYLLDHFDTPVVQDVIRRLAAEHHADQSAGDLPPWRDSTPGELRASVAAYVRWLMDRDRKSPGLKLLQGVIWENGYRAGELHGEVFDDVPRAVERWRSAGIDVAIYSSGSELAQRLLFASTRYGDFTPQMAGFFDTGVGAKTAAESYRRIAKALGRLTSEVLFVSDVTAELAAAAEAGCLVRLCMRPGNIPQPDAARHDQIRSFDELP